MNFRLRLMFATVFAAACLIAAAVSLWSGHVPAPLLLVLAALLALAFAAFAVERWARRPVRLLAERIFHLAQGNPLPRSAPPFDGVLGVLQRAVDQFVATAQGADAALVYEKTLRQQTETVLRESEQRNALALRCMNDGLWEWDLKSGAVHYSSAWKAALGYGDEEIDDGLREWHDRIHPDDRESVLRKLDAHIAGESALFECDQRLLHRDGGYRWFLVRGRAVHAASGKTYKVIGLNTDIGTRKRAEEILQGIANGLMTARGETFFKTIVKNFAETLRVKYAFITQCVDQPPTRVRMLAAWMDGKYDETLEYALDDTPCDITVRHNKVNLIPGGLAQLYPIEVGFQSYFGIPICDRAGMVIGHLACLDAKPMDADLPTLPIFTLFALRAGVEMELRLHEKLQCI